MAAEPVPPSGQSAAASGSEQYRAWWRRALDTLWRLVVTTVSSCLRYRVTGLAAEAAFFAVLSVPPLLFGLAGGIGYVTNRFDPSQVDQMRDAVIDFSGRLLTERAVNKVIEPTLDDVLEGGRFDIISLGFVLALWSGSRALNVFIDTITVMHGLGGHRGIIKTRALSFVLYVLARGHRRRGDPADAGRPAAGRRRPAPSVRLPARLLLAGGRRDLHLLPRDALPRVGAGADPLAVQPPGAVFSLVAWIVGSYLLRWILTVTAADSRSIYGPLAAPIAVLLWLYIVAIAVLIGAAVNAAFDKIFVGER